MPLAFDDEQQSYRIPGTYFLPPTNFTPQEALAVILTCQNLGDSGGIPLLEHAQAAALKLESSLPSAVREYLRGVSHAVEIHMPPSNPLENGEATFRQLLEAISEHRSVRIRYDSLTEWEEICTRLSPYRLLFSRRSWYCIGRSSLHRSTRTFNVGRIRKLEPTDTTYKVPQNFSIDRYLRNAWHLIPESGPDHRVRIRFRPQVAQNVAEVSWHKTQETEFESDGSLDFRVTVSGLGEIAWWVLGYGDQAEVIEPPELREMIAKRMATALAHYTDDSRGQT